MASAQDGAAGAAPINLEPRVRELRDCPPVPGRTRPKEKGPSASAIVSLAQPATRRPRRPPLVAEQRILSTPRESPGVHAGWDNGFFIRSSDNAYLLRITGQIQSDFRGYRMPTIRPTSTRFFLRRARFGIEATVFEHYEFRFLPDFGVARRSFRIRT